MSTQLILTIIFLIIAGIDPVSGQQKMHQQEPINIQQIKDIHSLSMLKQNNEFIAARYQNFDKSYSDNAYDSKLMIFKNDTLIYTIEKLIKKYTWIPNENRLIYLVYSLPRVGDRSPATEIGIFYADSLKHEKLIDLSKQIGYINRVQYIKFTNKVYLRRPGDIFQLDVENKQLLPTNLKGLNFSPNGRYYTNFSYEGEPISLYERTSNTIIWEGDNSEKTEEKLRFLSHLKWPGDEYETSTWHVDEDMTYLYLKNMYGVAKINCSTGQVDEFYKRPGKTMEPVLDNGNIQWKELNVPKIPNN